MIGLFFGLLARLIRKEKNKNCVEPNAPWVKCCMCSKEIKTCQHKFPVGSSSDCPIHPGGSQLETGEWVCSFQHWDTAMKEYYCQTA